MPYSSKTNWQYDEVLTERDLNRIEQGVANATAVAEAAETPTGAQAKVDTHSGGTIVHGATSAATASRIVLRDSNGRAKVAAPSAADDIARKDTVDTVQANVTNHQNATAVGIHGSTVAAAANTLMHRDSAGRAKVAAPIAGDDIARKDTVDAVQTNLANHQNATAVGTHGSTSIATANTLMHRDTAGRAKVAAPSVADDIARKDTVDAVQANLTNHQNATAAGTHGSTSAATANTLMHRDAAGRAKVAAPSAADDIARKDTVDAVKSTANTFTQRQTFAAGIQDGDSNSDVSLIKAIQHQVHTRSTALMYTADSLTAVEERDGASVLRTTTLTYSGGRIDTVTESAGGVSVARRFVYDADGRLVSVLPI